MIKRFCLLTLFLLCAIIATAQIQRKILDFTLGVTTKVQVQNYLKSHHYKYHLNEDGDFIVEKVTFAGHNWPAAFFCFYKGKLFLVDFRNNDDFTPVETMDLIWERLSNSLKKKYSNYSFSSSKDDGSLNFSDHKTRLTTNYTYLFGSKSLHIMYYDEYLFGQKYESDESEL